MQVDYIFVYGTLKQNIKKSKYNLISNFTKFVDYGYTYGTLYQISYYPAAKLNTNSKIYGEIYYIKDKDKLFEIVDEYEECTPKYPNPHEYKRVITDVFTNKNYKLQAWIYEYNLNTNYLKPILSGIFK